MTIQFAQKKSINAPALAAILVLAITAVGVLSLLTLHGAGAAMNYLTPEAFEVLAAGSGLG